MKKIALILLISVSTISAQKRTIDTKSSIINWTGKAAFSAYSLTGTLKTKEGYISIKNDSIRELFIIIDMKSLDHENADLKKHLRSKDFFEVKKYATATFELKAPVNIGKNEFILKGTMKIKEKTFEESINVIYNTEEAVLNFNSSLDRTKYGVTFNSPNFFKKLKQNAIADEFQIKGKVVFN
ncbi:MAG: YceI family protein [Jejuia sp.]